MQSRVARAHSLELDLVQFWKTHNPKRSTQLSVPLIMQFGGGALSLELDVVHSWKYQEPKTFYWIVCPIYYPDSGGESTLPGTRIGAVLEIRIMPNLQLNWLSILSSSPKTKPSTLDFLFYFLSHLSSGFRGRPPLLNPNPETKHQTRTDLFIVCPIYHPVSEGRPFSLELDSGWFWK